MVQSASGFCSTFTAVPTSTSLPPWVTACTAPDITSRIVSGCACLPTPTSNPSSPAPEIPTIYLCGDSTEAPGGGGNGTEGWGQYLHYSFDLSTVYVNNFAIAGRSARSYTREGRFDKIGNVLKPGDWVIIEFGHNDGGSPFPASSDIGRADCPGAGMFHFTKIPKPKLIILRIGNETCPTVYA
jgi:hypothetical protein